MEVIRLWEKRKNFRGSNEVLFRLDDLENRKHEKRYDRCGIPESYKAYPEHSRKVYPEPVERLQVRGSPNKPARVYGRMLYGCRYS
jgi:hypothetical protein